MTVAETLFAKLLAGRFAGGATLEGGEALVHIDQVMLGDGAGSLVFLTLEHVGVEWVRVGTAACYVDEVTVSEDGNVAEDQAYLLAASRRLGLLFSPPGHGVGPALHLERFAKPGSSVLGTQRDSGALGACAMLALAGSAMDGALVLAGEPHALTVPPVWRVRFAGAFPEWVGAVDAALELLRRHGVKGRAGTALEVTGEGVASLSIEERASFATVARELGVVCTLFPADRRLAEWLSARGRLSDFRAIAGDDDAVVAFDEILDLGTLEPLVAKPQSPANVVPVRFVESTPIGQAVLGSAAFGGERDLHRLVAMVGEKSVHAGVSFDFNPTSRDQLIALADSGRLRALLVAGVRVHEPGLGGHAGVGQAPAAGRASLRTSSQNFAGGSGTRDDRVYIASAATVAISAVRGVISRPSDAGPDPVFLASSVPTEERPPVDATTKESENATAPALRGFLAPSPRSLSVSPERSEEGTSGRPVRVNATPIVKGSSIKPLPAFDTLPRRGEFRVILKVPDGVPLHEIAPEGVRGLSLGSNVTALADHAFERIDITYVKRAKVAREQGGHVIVAGHDFGYGSQRDHSAFALRVLGLRVVLAKSFGGAFRRSLLNAGILPLTFVAESDYFPIEPGELMVFEDLRSSLASGPELAARRKAQSTFLTRHALTPRELSILLAGGVTNWLKTANLKPSPSILPAR